MAAWGQSSATKEAQGFPREFGAWNFGQFKDWLDKQNKFGWKGDALTDWYQGKLFERADQGGPSISSAWDAAGQVMPGVEEAIARRGGRLDTIGAGFRQLPTADYTMAQVNEATDAQGRRIGENYGDIQSEINDTYGRQSARDMGASQDVVGNLRDTYGSLVGATNDTFTGLRGQNVSTYGGLRDLTQQGFDQTRKDLEMLKPGSEFQVAQTNRSFAPMMAATMGRLRRSGVDPNSPQAQSVIQRVESARARAADDMAGAGTQAYVDRLTGARDRNLGRNIDLATAQFGNEAGLATGQLDRTTGLGREQGQQFRDEMLRSSGTQNALDAARSGQTIANTDTAFQRGQQLYDERKSNALLGRGLSQQDWQTAADLEREKNAEELTAIGLRDTQFNRGADWLRTDQAMKDAAIGALGNLGQASYANQSNAAQNARGFGNDALRSYLQSYQLTSPEDGWLKRLTGGLAGSALNWLSGGMSGGFGGLAKGLAGGAGGMF